MIAGRYLPVVCLLLGGALVPTLIHSYAADLPQDGRRAANIARELVGYTSRPTARNAAWGQRRFESDDWVERDYTNGKRTVRLTVIRSHDPKRLYHHPELAIVSNASFSGSRIETAPGRPDLPLHVLIPGPGQTAKALYALHYGSRFVEDPILFQVRTAGELLVSPRQTMTIFFALETQPAGSASPADLLVAAIDSFLAQAPESGTRAE